MFGKNRNLGKFSPQVLISSQILSSNFIKWSMHLSGGGVNYRTFVKVLLRPEFISLWSVNQAKKYTLELSNSPVFSSQKHPGMYAYNVENL